MKTFRDLIMLLALCVAPMFAVEISPTFTGKKYGFYYRNVTQTKEQQLYDTCIFF